jgi:probable phosphoglycerate mutase
VIYLLRHGQTEYNAERRIQGRCDSPLTALGREQAAGLGRLLGEELGSLRTSVPIFSSPLGRAMASAEIIREHAGIAAPIQIDERLMEIGCGSWERLTRPEIAERHPAFVGANSFMEGWRDHCPDGETLMEAMARADDWLRWAEGRTIVAVSHGITGIILRALHERLDSEAMLMLPCPQDRIYRLHGGTVSELIPA